MEVNLIFVAVRHRGNGRLCAARKVHPRHAPRQTDRAWCLPKGNEALWTDDNLDEIRPAVLVDDQTISVTSGSSTPLETKGARPKATTYVFAAAHQDAASILATGIDDTTAEIFRSYLGNKVLCKLTSSPSPGTTDSKMASSFVGNLCRDESGAVGALGIRAHLTQIAVKAGHDAGAVSQRN